MRTLALQVINQLQHFSTTDLIDQARLEELNWLSEEAPVHLYLVDSYDRLTQVVQGVVPGCRSIIAYALPQSEMPRVAQTLHHVSKSRYHLLFPDLKKGGWVLPSREKVLDAVLCGSSRSHTKYQSLHLGPIASIMHGDDFLRCAEFLKSTGELITREGLNPGLVDGFIGMRVGERLVITSTKTDKSNITPVDVCVVTHYDVQTDQVSWYGQRQPSSETSCAWLAMMEQPQYNFIAHFHCKHYTYGDRYESIRAPHYVAYGLSAEAEEARRLCLEVGPFFVLKGHGEFLCCRQLKDAAPQLKAIAAEAACAAC